MVGNRMPDETGCTALSPGLTPDVILNDEEGRPHRAGRVVKNPFCGGGAVPGRGGIVFMNSRTDLFGYMVQIARDLPRGVTLSEEDISEFVTQTNTSGTNARLDWLRKNQERYQYFGNYWLELADFCCEKNDFECCLAAID